MKKSVSLLIAFTMILASIAFALPTAIGAEPATPAPVLEYTFDSDLQGWTFFGYDSLVWKAGGIVSMISSGQGSSGYFSPSSLGLTGSTAKFINIRAKNNSSATSIKIYYTATNGSFGADRAFDYPLTAKTSDYVDYFFDMSNVTGWQGSINQLMVAFRSPDGTLDVDYIRFYTERPADPGQGERMYEMKISASSTSITENMGIVTVTPTVTTNIADAAKTVSYTTNNNNALVTKNTDGTLTVQGMINGSVTVTAISDYDQSTASITINISGQPARISSYDLCMAMFGNSILLHPPAENLGWSGNWGMAASSEDKDYAHRLQYYLSEKYGTVETSRTRISDFERSIKASDTYQYLSELAFVKGSFASLSHAPEIVTIQMGENVNTDGLTASQYKNAIRQFIAEIRKYAAPNAQIVVTTPFWGGSVKIRVMEEIAEELDLRIAYLDTLKSNENMALGLFENSGVAIHPGDTGMDNIAKLFYAELLVDLTENIQPDYGAGLEALTVTGASDKITASGGTLALSVSATPQSANNAVFWSSSDNNLATVDASGTVTAKNNGVVTITATSKSDSTITDTYEITVSGQTEPFTLTYDANTADTVTGMPSANTFAKNDTALSTVFPVRKYYTFAGWSTSRIATPDSIVSSVTVNSDLTVYAVWKPAVEWDFEIPGYLQGVTVDSGFNVEVIGGNLVAIATGTDAATGNVLKFVSPVLNLNSGNYTAFNIRMQNTATNAATTLSLTITTDADTYNFSKPITGTTVTDYSFDISSVKGTVKGFTIAPTNIDCTVNISEMGFATAAGSATVYGITYNLDGGTNGNNPQRYPEGTAEIMLAPATKEGYTFGGWFDNKELAGDAVTVIPTGVCGEITLFAKWSILPSSGEDIATQAASTTEKPKESGCGSVALPSALTLMALSFGGALVFTCRRRKF